jgi:hypothetical protein
MGFISTEKINYDLFIKNYTPESSYILGLLWADGHINKKSNSINIECVKEDIDIFYPIFQKTGNFNLYYRNRLNRKPQGIINCSSLNLSQFLKINDYSNKSQLSPNKILSSIPKELKHYFFRGWVDGDGCFYYNKKLHLMEFIMSGTYNQDWSSLIILCEKLNINYKISQITTKKGHQHSRFLIKKKTDIVIFGNFIYKENTFGLKRKYDKFLPIKENLENEIKKRILCYNKDNQLIKEFNSLSSASLWLDKGRNVSSDINDCIKKRQKTALGYKWEMIKN